MAFLDSLFHSFSQLPCSWHGASWTRSTGGAAPPRLCRPPPCSSCWVPGCWWASLSPSSAASWERTEPAASRRPVAPVTLPGRSLHSPGTSTRLYTWPLAASCRSGELSLALTQEITTALGLHCKFLVVIKRVSQDIYIYISIDFFFFFSRIVMRICQIMKISKGQNAVLSRFLYVDVTLLYYCLLFRPIMLLFCLCIKSST